MADALKIVKSKVESHLGARGEAVDAVKTIDILLSGLD